MRIAIVNDMLLAIESLRRGVLAMGIHQVAWIAHDGVEAIQRCAEDKPDLILMDLLMPGMDGVEATRQIMAKTPCPILIVTTSIDSQSARVFEAMGAGALDAVNTPILDPQSEIYVCDGCETFQAKLKTIEKLTRVTLPGRSVYMNQPNDINARGGGKLVVIGSSTGGPQTLAQILSRLPADYPAPVIIVQHVDAQFAGEMATWLNKQCLLNVRLAREGDCPEVGTVLLAGTNNHLVMHSNQYLGYTHSPAELAYRPSVDVFFESVAKHWKGQVAAALLTGMGRDGAQGLLRLREHGAHTIAQDEASCIVYGMPKAAADLKAAIEILPLGNIAPTLIKHFKCIADINVGTKDARLHAL